MKYINIYIFQSSLAHFMEYEVKKLTLEKVMERGECIELNFKEVGPVIFSKTRFNEEFLSNLKPGKSVYATIENLPVPYVHQLTLLPPIGYRT